MKRRIGGTNPPPYQQIIVDNADFIKFDDLIWGTMMHQPRGFNKFGAAIYARANSIKINEVFGQQFDQIIILARV